MMELKIVGDVLEVSRGTPIERRFLAKRLGLSEPGDAAHLVCLSDGRIVAVRELPHLYLTDDGWLTEAEDRARIEQKCAADPEFAARQRLVDDMVERCREIMAEEDDELDLTRSERARGRRLAQCVESQIESGRKAKGKRGAAAITRIYPDVDDDGVLETRGVDAGRRAIILGALHEVAAEAGLDERELKRRERARKLKAATRKRGAATVTRVYPAD